MDDAHRVLLMLLIPLMMIVTGCASFAKGMTQAILERNRNDEDRRVCQIRGPAFTGIEPLIQPQGSGQRNTSTGQSLGRTTRPIRVLIIHGIGKHDPGYAARLIENLTRALKLNRTSERAKTVNLRDAELGDESLGRLIIQRYFNQGLTRELMFYELSWSEIVDAERHVIAYDDSGAYASRRTALNHTLKSFLNTRLSDPLIYLGPNARIKILKAVLQSLCWMSQGGWDELEADIQSPCDQLSKTNIDNFAKQEFVVVTHSLGSRIIIDALQHAVEISRTAEIQAMVSSATGSSSVRPLNANQIANLKRLFRAIQHKTIHIFMLANQLPLLQLGRELPEIRGRLSQYCRVDGVKHDERYFKALSIVAFSDPNDILSYAIPPTYRDDYFDSRLCPRITNVILNVAPVGSLLGLEAANPLEAHVGYDNDERVIALIAKGFQPGAIDPLVQARCTWLETVE